MPIFIERLLCAECFARGFKTQSHLLLTILCPLPRWGNWRLDRKGHQLGSGRGRVLKSTSKLLPLITVLYCLFFLPSAMPLGLNLFFSQEIIPLTTSYLSSLPKQVSHVCSPFCLDVQDHSGSTSNATQPYLFLLSWRKRSTWHVFLANLAYSTYSNGVY